MASGQPLRQARQLYAKVERDMERWEVLAGSAHSRLSTVANILERLPALQRPELCALLEEPLGGAPTDEEPVPGFQPAASTTVRAAAAAAAADPDERGSGEAVHRQLLAAQLVAMDSLLAGLHADVAAMDAVVASLDRAALDCARTFGFGAGGSSGPGGSSSSSGSSPQGGRGRGKAAAALAGGRGRGGGPAAAGAACSPTAAAVCAGPVPCIGDAVEALQDVWRMHRDELCVWTAALARITYDMQAADAAHLAALLAAGVCIDRQAARDMLHMVLGSVDQQEALQQR